MKQMIRVGTLAVAYSLTLGLALAQPPTGRPGGRGGRDGFGGRGPQGFASAPLARDEAEKKILDVLEAMQQQGLGMSVPRDDGRLLRLLTL